MDKITSTSNVKVKRLVSLKKKRKARDEEKVFLVEGIRMFREVPAESLKEVYVSESFYKKERDVIEQLAAFEVLSDTVFDYVSDTRTPQGILCVAEQMQYTLETVTQGEKPHIVVLDHLQDPGNLGTIFRTAEGAGVTGIIMDRECVDIYNPKTIRSTMGSIYRMPFCYIKQLPAAIGFLKERGIQTYAAHLEGRRNYDEENYCRPCAFLIGNEGNGLTKEIADLADTYIKIPMKGQVESLNAAIAASVLMFEAARQRRK
ncbi:MAG: RNA methyltransferase [Dorea sp.]|jgi:TrmH family RNA methyltransferase|nr:RNA methyltransferase [Dorea sp.]